VLAFGFRRTYLIFISSAYTHSKTCPLSSLTKDKKVKKEERDSSNLLLILFYKQITEHNLPLIRYFVGCHTARDILLPLNTCSLVFLRRKNQQVADTLGVAPFVIVPGDKLDEILVERNTRLCVEDG